MTVIVTAAEARAERAARLARQARLAEDAARIERLRLPANWPTLLRARVNGPLTLEQAADLVADIHNIELVRYKP
jgi:hypothetical protein